MAEVLESVKLLSEVLELVSAQSVAFDVLHPRHLQLLQSVKGMHLHLEVGVELLVIVDQLLPLSLWLLELVGIQSLDVVDGGEPVAATEDGHVAASLRLMVGQVDAWVISSDLVIYLVFLLLRRSDNVEDSLPDLGVLLMCSSTAAIVTIQQALQFTAGSQSFHVVRGSVERLSLMESSSKWNTRVSREVVVRNLVGNEAGGLLLNLVEVPQVGRTLSKCFWELELALDLSWDEGKSFGSVVLDSTWNRNVPVVVEFVRTMWQKSFSFIVAVGIDTNPSKGLKRSSHFVLLIKIIIFNI